MLIKWFEEADAEEVEEGGLSCEGVEGF